MNATWYDHVRQMTHANDTRAKDARSSMEWLDEIVSDGRRDVQKLNRVLDLSPLPMLMVDDRRCYVDGNRPARLAFRLSMAKLRDYRLGDLSPPHELPKLDAAWAWLLDTGHAAGRYEVTGPDGSSLEVEYAALANVLPGRHLIVFVPADWPEDELEERCTAGVRSRPQHALHRRVHRHDATGFVDN